jgi:dTDP-glucose pyrophosphorylase
MERRINLIPLAGAGKRFLDAGYVIPKPLIEVAGKPMIVRAASSLPEADLWVFACRQEHIIEAHIDKTLRENFQPAEIISVPQLTEGQASTCLLAREILSRNDILTIGACDNDMLYDAGKYVQLLSQPDCEAIIWTFRNNPAVLQNPRMYGWVEVDPDNRAKRVSVKTPISDSPMNDHAVIGAFTFKKAGDFIQFADDMIRQNRRINNEFYADELMNLLIEGGKKVYIFEVDRYICWGTPQDLAVYNYWHGYFDMELQKRHKLKPTINGHVYSI